MAVSFSWRSLPLAPHWPQEIAGHRKTLCLNTEQPSSFEMSPNFCFCPVAANQLPDILKDQIESFPNFHCQSDVVSMFPFFSH